MPQIRQTFLIMAALFCTYFIWGSTYLAIRFGIESFPPFLMAGVRFTIAGAICMQSCAIWGRPIPRDSSGWVLP